MGKHVLYDIIEKEAKVRYKAKLDIFTRVSSHVTVLLSHQPKCWNKSRLGHVGHVGPVTWVTWFRSHPVTLLVSVSEYLV